jgi:hypothetical protein
VRLGNDGQRGAVQAKILWQGATIVNGFLLMVFRLFTPAATSASLDLRFALMALAYETFILGLGIVWVSLNTTKQQQAKWSVRHQEVSYYDKIITKAIQPRNTTFNVGGCI